MSYSFSDIQIELDECLTCFWKMWNLESRTLQYHLLAGLLPNVTSNANPVSASLSVPYFGTAFKYQLPCHPDPQLLPQPAPPTVARPGRHTA